MATSSNERGPARPAFFLWCAILFAAPCPSGLANAEPLRLEVERAFPGSVERTNEPLVVFRLTVPSARQFATFTVQNVNKRIEIRVDGIVINKPVIREPILGGMLQLVGLRADEAKDIANRLSSGAAKLEVEVSAD